MPTKIPFLTLEQYEALRRDEAPCPAVRRGDSSPTTIMVTGYGLLEQLNLFLDAARGTRLNESPTPSVESVRVGAIDATVCLNAAQYEAFRLRMPPHSLYTRAYDDYVDANPGNPEEAPLFIENPPPGHVPAIRPVPPTAPAADEGNDLYDFESEPDDNDDDDDTPPEDPSGEPNNRDLMAAIMGFKDDVEEVNSKLESVNLDIDRYDRMFADDRQRLRRLEDAVYGTNDTGLPYNGPGAHAAPSIRTGWLRNKATSLSTSGREYFRSLKSDGGWLRAIGVVVGIFIATYLSFMLIFAFLGAVTNYGAIAAIANWGWLITLIAVIAAVIAGILHFRSITASAATREERN